MIHRLRKKFIVISTVSVVSVVLLVFLAMTAFNISSMNKTVDTLADSVSMGGGRFPDYFDKEKKFSKPPEEPVKPNFITPETQFSTCYFTVWLGKEGELLQTDIEFIAAITEENAVQYAQQAVETGKERGWLANYRYRISETQKGIEVVFIDGTMNKASFFQNTMISETVLMGCALLVLTLIVILSKRAVRPIAEGYEKQKQFITDANHELKTPLTLILANLDIAEAELGKNEWLEDIRAEGYRMTGLVNQLVALSRMDEEGQPLPWCELPLSDIVSDISAEFQPFAEKKGINLSVSVEPDLILKGDEMLIRRLVSGLLDNAVKYCDADGEILVSLSGARRMVLTVENTYRDVNSVELNRLFDRFYRADKARKFTGGYGIGLSIAKAIAERYHGDITAYQKDSSHIGFKVVLRP